MSAFSTTAFAAPIASLASSRSPFANRSPTAIRAARPAARSVARATLSEDRPSRLSNFNRSEKDRIARKESEYNGPQGFTPYAELVNGRLAQMGFVIGLVTELVSGKPIGEQIGLLLTPVAQLAQELTVLSASAHIHHVSL